jgi:hypothetical protein
MEQKNIPQIGESLRGSILCIAQEVENIAKDQLELGMATESAGIAILHFVHLFRDIFDEDDEVVELVSNDLMDTYWKIREKLDD